MLSGKVPKNPPERRSNPKFTYNPHEGESREYNISQLYYITGSLLNYYKPSSKNSERYLKFKLKVVQSSTAAEIKRVLNDDTRCHDEART